MAERMEQQLAAAPIREVAKKAHDTLEEPRPFKPATEEPPPPAVEKGETPPNGTWVATNPAQASAATAIGRLALGQTAAANETPVDEPSDLTEYTTTRKLAIPSQSGGFGIGSTEVVIQVRGEMLTRLDGLVASWGQLSLKPELKRFRGRPTDKPFGEGARRMLRAAGEGRFVVSREGRVFTALEASGRLRDTLIIFTADHGDFLGDHWLGEKEQFYDTVQNIPLIVYDPSAEADATRGSADARMVSAVDVVPTVLYALGLPPADHRVEGRSLLDLTRERGEIRTEDHTKLFRIKAFAQRRRSRDVRLENGHDLPLGRGLVHDGGHSTGAGKARTTARRVPAWAPRPPRSSRWRACRPPGSRGRCRPPGTCLGAASPPAGRRSRSGSAARAAARRSSSRIRWSRCGPSPRP